MAHLFSGTTSVILNQNVLLAQTDARHSLLQLEHVPRENYTTFPYPLLVATNTLKSLSS